MIDSSNESIESKKEIPVAIHDKSSSTDQNENLFELSFRSLNDDSSNQEYISR